MFCGAVLGCRRLMVTRLNLKAGRVLRLPGFDDDAYDGTEVAATEMAARPTPVHFHNAADGLATTVELTLGGYASIAALRDALLEHARLTPMGAKGGMETAEDLDVVHVDRSAAHKHLDSGALRIDDFRDGRAAEVHVRWYADVLPDSPRRGPVAHAKPTWDEM